MDFARIVWHSKWDNLLDNSMDILTQKIAAISKNRLFQLLEFPPLMLLSATT